MKRRINYFAAVVCIAAFSSCTNELDNNPIGLLTEDQIDTEPTVTTIESSVFSAYQPLKNTLNGIIPDWRWDLGTVFRNDIVLQDIAAHDMNKKWNSDGDQAWIDRISDFTFTADNQAFNGIWVYDYEGISRANLAIQFLTNPEVVGSTGIGEGRRDQLLSEAYFLRAFYYFDLLNNFGDVPLILASPDSFQEAFELSVRAPSEEVRAQINADLTAAKSISPNAKYADASEPWRASKGAIVALQAKVALFNDNWGDALSLIDELDALGFYSLNANYFDSFDVNKEFADNEVIFAYDHRSEENPRNGNGFGAVTSWGFFAPTADFLEAFEPSDPRLLYTIEVPAQRSSKILGSTSDFIGNDDSPGDRIYMRYADVLLWKAEALNEMGNSSGAIALINEIRARARTSATADGTTVPAGTLPDRPVSSDAAQISDWLKAERRVELGFEAHRFNDLKRWGIAQEVLSALDVNFKDYNVLYPIPQSDIDKSGGTIVQNPGY